MKNSVNNISLQYGDAKISFFGIEISNSDDLSPVWHKHNYYELHYCFEKTREYKFQDKNVRFKQGQFMLIPPDISHNTLSDFDSVFTAPIALVFTVTKTKNDSHFYDKIIASLQNHSLTPLTLPGISLNELACFHDINMYSSFLGLCKLKASASNVIYQLFSHILSDVTFSAESDENTLVLIDNLLNNPLYSLADIANATNYSQRHLSRIIKQHYGLTFSELRRKIKEENKQ